MPPARTSSAGAPVTHSLPGSPLATAFHSAMVVPSCSQWRGKRVPLGRQGRSAQLHLDNSPSPSPSPPLTHDNKRAVEQATVNPALPRRSEGAAPTVGGEAWVSARSKAKDAGASRRAAAEGARRLGSLVASIAGVRRRAPFTGRGRLRFTKDVRERSGRLSVTFADQQSDSSGTAKL